MNKSTVRERHEGAHREGVLHVQVQGEGEINNDNLSNVDKTYLKNINAPVQSIQGGHPEGEKRTMSQITDPEGWKKQNPDDGKVICGPDGQLHEGVHSEGDHHQQHGQAHGERGTPDSQEPKLTRTENMRRMREQRRQATVARKKLLFQQVECDLTVARKQEPRTKRGQKLLEAMMVNRNLVQDRTQAMVVVGADVRLSIHPYLRHRWLKLSLKP